MTVADCPKDYTQAQHAAYARAVYARPFVSERARKRVLEMRRCQQTGKARVNARRLTRRLRSRHALRRLTPYKCGSHGWFAVPCGIVAKESGFSCTAQNPTSSAYGYYQLLDTWWGHLGRYPTCAEQHRIAFRLWGRGAGASHWAATVG